MPDAPQGRLEPQGRLDPSELQTDRPHSARVYNYIIGGEDNFAPDRETAAEVLAGWPGLRTSMLANRACMRRMARYLTGLGLRQFVDVGSGIPTSPNLHEVVQAAAPDARIVYVDNDPIVLAHARELLTSTDEGRTAYIQADMRDPEALLGDRVLHGLIDLTRPVALTVIAMLQFVADARGLVDALVGPLAPGSHVAVTVPTGDLAPESRRLAEQYTRSGIPMYLRDRAEVERLFSGLEILAPGVVPMPRWRPEPGAAPLPDTATNMYAAVARKP
ncbi:SAM-dependent methyltransferase [Actinomadura decatromicini]|uniref:SAM-dependent methyltransferase n=1 Tax=Actinomadura decatromicini TaxID=2604572 RepID=A0A5D3FYJ8_9ACTN|nr:SAM-dependent methyltransferase [Actinomadura decatromicini]TYK53243.1 SAM-dependent methyltransferase [Actinomadura decatromicini]